jgi:hypothetical protein
MQDIGQGFQSPQR